MNLTILLPFRIYAKLNNVLRVVAETAEGSFGLLPHRLDCVAALIPGILSYTTSADDLTYLAVDKGTLIKGGDAVVISVRRVIAGTNLNNLHKAVVQEYLTLDAQEREMRSVLAKMESGFIARLAGLNHDRQ
jgi:F-type H+-transporting ATPase subunit epsilon